MKQGSGKMTELVKRPLGKCEDLVLRTYLKAGGRGGA